MMKFVWIFLIFYHNIVSSLKFQNLIQSSSKYLIGLVLSTAFLNEVTPSPNYVVNAYPDTEIQRFKDGLVELENLNTNWAQIVGREVNGDNIRRELGQIHL
jgi:hypothetical protein